MRKLSFFLCLLFLSLSLQAQLYSVCNQHFTPVHELTRPMSEIKNLNIGTINVLNLYQAEGRYELINGTRVYVPGEKDKPLWQQEQIANAILESNLDFVVLEEIEGIEALDAFNNKFMQDKYFTISFPGNDTRGIDIGFLVKKDLPFEMQLFTNKHIKWNNPSKNNQEELLFSRDLPVLMVYLPGTSARGPPDLVIIGTHFKAQIGKGQDPTSKIPREAQAKKTAEIIKQLKIDYGENLPVILAGDFNAHIKNSEFSHLTEDGLLKDAFDIKGVPEADRITHTYHPQDGPSLYGQLDAIMVTPALEAYIKEAKVYRYKDANGIIKPLPQTHAERELNPSDHFLIHTVIDLEGLRTAP